MHGTTMKIIDVCVMMGVPIPLLKKYIKSIFVDKTKQFNNNYVTFLR
jgi:purine-nucleoside phosphorylase